MQAPIFCFVRLFGPPRPPRDVDKPNASCFYVIVVYKGVLPKSAVVAVQSIITQDKEAVFGHSVLPFCAICDCTGGKIIFFITLAVDIDVAIFKGHGIARKADYAFHVCRVEVIEKDDVSSVEILWLCISCGDIQAPGVNRRLHRRRRNDTKRDNDFEMKRVTRSVIGRTAHSFTNFLSLLPVVSSVLTSLGLLIKMPPKSCDCLTQHLVLYLTILYQH